MAIELQVSMAVVTTEPDIPSNPGILVRSTRTTTLVAEDNMDLAGAWVLAGSVLGGLIRECEADMENQIEISEHSARSAGNS